MSPWMRSRLSDDPLSAAEEARLAREAVTSPTAREQLIDKSLGLAILHALRLGRLGEDLDDAVQDGIIGLIAAVDRFDPERGVRLATFAWPWIDGAIRRGGLSRTAVPLTVDVPDEPAVTMAFEVADGPPSLADGLWDFVTGESERVLRLRFGFVGDPLSRREVADVTGMSLSRVRALERLALDRMRRRVGEPLSHRTA